MKHVRKISILLALVMMLGLVACGSSSSKSTNPLITDEVLADAEAVIQIIDDTVDGKAEKSDIVSSMRSYYYDVNNILEEYRTEGTMDTETITANRAVRSAITDAYSLASDYKSSGLYATATDDDMIDARNAIAEAAGLATR